MPAFAGTTVGIRMPLYVVRHLACVLLIFFCLAGLLPDRAFSDPSIPDSPTNFSSHLSGLMFYESIRSRVYAASQPTGSVVQGNAADQPNSISPVDRITQINREVVRLFHGQGNYEEALPLALEACELARRTLGEEHPGFADSLDNLAAIYKATGKYDQAEPLLQQALAVWKKALGENSPDYAISLNNLAGLYSATGRYAEAEALYLRVLETVRANVGEDNAYFVKSLNNLASLYKAMGNYVEVEPLYTKAADILLKISGESEPDYAIVISNLGQYYYLAGRYPEAESSFRESLEITRKTVGEQHPQYARTLNNLASLYEAMGNYTKTEPLYQQALALLTAKSGKNSPDVAAALNNLAGLYKTMGDYGRAESFFRQANDIWRTALGEKNPELASGLANVADLYYSMGKFEAAGKLYESSLEIQRSSLGEKHPDVALTMQNLAVLYKTMGRYQEAEPLYRKALEIWKSGLGDRHPNVGLALHNLAALYHGMGRYPEAEPLYRQALEIRSTVLGEDHPDVATTQNNLAALYAASSRENEALELMEQAQVIHDHMIRHIFAIASESQRMGYIAVLRGDMDAFLSLIAQYLSNSPTAARAGLDLVLKRKAIVAEALATQRDAILGGRYPDLEPTLRRLRTLSAQIAQKMMSGPGLEGVDAHRQLLEKWKAEKERIEVSLASRIPEINLERRLMGADRQAVAKALPEGAVLVEFIRFHLFDFKAIPAQGQSPWKPAHYLAFVLSSDEPENILMIDLGEAENIDRMISEFRSTITGEAEKPGGRGIATRSDGRAHTETPANLHAAVFDPLLKGLRGQKRLFLAPDGDLYRLPFGVLPMNTEHRVVDDYHISYVGAGRDLLRFGMASSLEPTAPLVIADPDYDLDAGAQADQSSKVVPQERQSRDLIRYASHFDRLPGTRVEGESVAKMLDVKSLEGRLATKRQLVGARSPRILHIATHGFFLPDQAHSPGQKDLPPDSGRGPVDRQANPLSRAMENPLLRSGLVLAGANSWLQGKRLPPEAEDGILTGEDAAGLDLLATDLVVLSACETGLGDIKVGEGVFGLRRAFLLAGAKTLLMSLWKIPDEETQMLMEGYYQRILAGQPREDALREAQLAVKAIHPEPLYWGAFICQGDPGPLPSLGQKNGPVGR